LKFLGDESLAFTVDELPQTPPGIHFFSIWSRSIERYFPLDEFKQRAIVLSDSIVVQEFSLNRARQLFHTFDIDARDGDAPLATFASPHVNTGMSLSSDGRFAAFYWRNAKLKFLNYYSDSARLTVVYDIRNEEDVDGLPVGNSIRFDPFDRKVIVCAESIDCFDWPSKKKRWSVDDLFCTDIRFSPDGSKFGVRELEADWLHILETDSGNHLQKIRLNRDSGLAFAFSADSQGIWIPSLDGTGGVEEIDVVSKTVQQKIGGSNSHYRWVVYFILFAVWAVAYARFVPGPNNKSWSAFWCVAPGAVLLSIIAMKMFFSDVPRSLEFGAYSNFHFTLASSYIMLAATSSMMVCGCRCCPILKTKGIPDKTSD